MKSTSWRGIAEFVGVAAIVASLVFVGLQIQQDRDLARIGDYSAYTESQIGLAGLIAENRDVWIQGLDGDELSSSNQMLFETMVRIYYRMEMFAYLRAQNLGGREVQSVINQYAFHMYQYPGLRSAFERHSVQSRHRNTAFGREPEDSYRQKMRDALAGLDTTSPPLPPRDYVFR